MVLITGLFLFSCSLNDDDDNGRTFSDEQKELEAFILENNISESAKQESGLYYIELIPGEGEVLSKGDKVKVKYKGMFLDGSVFDQNLDEEGAFEFPLGTGYVIPGWDEGVALMKKGGKSRLIVPSYLAYGPAGGGSIPPFSALVFEVEVLK
ncbi:MAG: FKBP-type peptidyl-prolyl cis-trans isomerase [Marinifilaceae bacterium]